MGNSSGRGAQARHDNQFAMRLSLAVGVLMLVGNAYMTGQTVAVNGGLHFN